MTDALLLGLTHALLAAAYATGAALPAVAVAAFARLCALPLYRRAHRTVVSRRLHRQARATGRDTRHRSDGGIYPGYNAPVPTRTLLNGSESIATGR